MSFYLWAAAAAAAFAALTAWLLLPLARWIPERINQHWQAEAQLHVLHELGELERPRLPGYPRAWVIALGALLCWLVLAVYGWNLLGAAACLYFFALLLLLTINVRDVLLPDMVVLPTLWGALLFHAAHGQASEHLYSTAVAYAVPFALSRLLQRFTGSELMGNGDIKTFAMAGAWFGLAALPTLFAVFVFSITVHGALVQWKKRATRLLPSGPAHMLASLACMLYSQMR